MKRKHLTVIKETDSGRNKTFKDTRTGRVIPRAQLVKEIGQGKHPGYHVREVNGTLTPVSNPDGKEGNNLG